MEPSLKGILRAEKVRSFVGKGRISEDIIVGINSFKKPPPDPNSTTLPGGSL